MGDTFELVGRENTGKRPDWYLRYIPKIIKDYAVTNNGHCFFGVSVNIFEGGMLSFKIA